MSQPSKCLKFMTFREGCFVIRSWMQVLKWSTWDVLWPLITQKMKEDDISQLGDYDVPFCEQYTHRSCYISLFKFKSFDQLIPPPPPPQTTSNFRHLLGCGTIDLDFIKLKLYENRRKVELYLLQSHISVVESCGFPNDNDKNCFRFLQDLSHSACMVGLTERKTSLALSKKWYYAVHWIDLKLISLTSLFQVLTCFFLNLFLSGILNYDI